MFRVKLILTLLLLQLSMLSFSQTKQQQACIPKWTYIQTTVPIKGTLIHFSPMADCGYFRTATLSIVKTDMGDTIRVLQMCDTTKTIEIGSKVTLLPNSKDEEKANLIPSNPETDCLIRKTFYGRLLRG